MKVRVTRTDLNRTRAEAVLLGVFEGRRGLGPREKAWDKKWGGLAGDAIRDGDFKGSPGEVLVLRRAGRTAPRRVVLVGLGKPGEVSGDVLRRAYADAVRRLGPLGFPAALAVLPDVAGGRGKLGWDDACQAITEGAVLGAYRFDRYRSEGKDKKRLGRLYLVAQDARVAAAAEEGARRGEILAESQAYARDLANLPGNDLYPEALARAARKLARETGLTCRVLKKSQLVQGKFGGLLAVGGGSDRDPCLIVLEHLPKRAPAKTLVVVGKGVTFDTGGISIKPWDGMWDMKYDMGGAAAALGVMRAVALLKPARRVVGIIPSAENMPSGRAYRPGDIVRMHSGKTVEIRSTDAEGRMILADALSYAHRYDPAAVVDMATLTGACMIALGTHAAGLFGNDPKLIDETRAAAERTGERAWPFPMWSEYSDMMKGDQADLKNGAGRWGGAITAAAFLKEFADPAPWVHLDIAGVGWTDANRGHLSKGGTGFGVRLVTDLILNGRY
jgi:leucyl aminopeptidase